MIAKWTIFLSYLVPLTWQFGFEWVELTDLVTLQTGIILIFVPRFIDFNIGFKYSVFYLKAVVNNLR